MNKENIQIVIDGMKAEALVKEGIGFNMGSYYIKASSIEPDQMKHNCGSVACIAGWTVGLIDGSKALLSRDRVLDIHYRAAALLDIVSYEADDLFGGAPGDIDLIEVTPAQAIRTLEHLRDTGEVDWDAANPE